jgi:hypothetical protein
VPSHLAAVVALVVALVMITTVFAWPGLVSESPHCNPPTVKNETVNGLTYCVTSVFAPPKQCINMTGNPTQPVNWTSFWGFEFGLSWAGGGSCGFGNNWMNITVVEPTFITYRGGIGFSGIHLGLPEMWVAPDNESGVDFRSCPTIVMVESGF